MKAIATLLDLIPSWVWAAAVFALSGLVVFTYIELGSARLSLADALTEVSSLKVAIAESNTKAAEQKADIANQVLKAQNEAKLREATLRAYAAAARTESDGMRGDLADLRQQYDKLSRDAVIERAAAVGVVLAQCTERYQGVAEKAERHASDVKTLIDAWPKSVSSATAADNLKR